MNDELPPGWVLASVGDVAEVLDSRRIPLNQMERSKRPGPFPYYGANGQVDTIDGYLFEGRHILLAEDGGYFDDPFRPNAYEVDGKFWVNNHAHILRAGPAAEHGFLLNALNATDLMPFVSGTTRLKLTQADMRRIPIALPPLAEQRRIIARIEALFARTRTARADLLRIALLAQLFRQAVLGEAFSGGLTADWRAQNGDCQQHSEPGHSSGGGTVSDLSTAGVRGLRPLRDAVTSLDQGWSPKCLDEASDDAETWAVIKTTAIQPGTFVASENKVLPPTLAPRPALQIAAGDVLITRAGPRSRVGIACFVSACRPRLLLCDKAYRLKVRREAADPEYVGSLLNAPPLLTAIEDLKSGISDSGLNLTQDRFLSLQIPLPPLAEQRRIVARIKAAFAHAEPAGKETARALALVDRLETTILEKAFRGELVPQDPADEPTTVTLARATTAVPDRRRRGRAPRAA